MKYIAFIFPSRECEMIDVYAHVPLLSKCWSLFLFFPTCIPFFFLHNFSFTYIIVSFFFTDVSFFRSRWRILFIVLYSRSSLFTSSSFSFVLVISFSPLIFIHVSSIALFSFMIVHPVHPDHACLSPLTSLISSSRLGSLIFHARIPASLTNDTMFITNLTFMLSFLRRTFFPNKEKRRQLNVRITPSDYIFNNQYFSCKEKHMYILITETNEVHGYRKGPPIHSEGVCINPLHPYS